MISDVGTSLLRTAGWGLWLLLVSSAAWAQTSVPGIPTIDTVTAGSSTAGLTLAVTWTAPTSDGGAAIEAYDLRFIKTAADETDDANWIVEEKVWESGDGALSTTLAGLTDSTEYDVQVRAVNENGLGAWSATATGTTQDHGDTAAGATSLTLSTPMGGVIDPGDDVDYFTFTLTRETGILIETTGALDTVGELQNSSGTVLESNDDGPFSDSLLNFFMWHTLAAGTYRLKLSSYGEATGSYVLYTRTLVDTSGITDAQEITFDSDGNGIEGGLIDPDGDTDYFTFTLSATTDIVIRTTGLIGDTVGTLLNSDGTEEIAFNDDGDLPSSSLRFLIRTRLDAGTYHIAVEGYNENDIGFYNLRVNKVTEPGNTTADAAPLLLSEAGGGRIDPSSDEDYFRLVLTEETNISVGAVSETVNIDGELLDAGGNAVDTNLSEGAFGNDGPWVFSLSDRLDAGTYYIKVTRSGDTDPGGEETGLYTIRAYSFASFLDHCANIDRPSTVEDPLYGCQWHLNNERQLKGGIPDEDINVEAVWDDGTLGAGINVAVVDDGMDYAHEDLSANVNTARNHDYTGGGDIYDPFEIHGTAVAGIIAARDNSLGVRGVAPRATLYGYNLFLDSTDANEADAMQRDLETDVSNNSWGPGDGRGLDAAPGIWEMAIEKGITEGSDGKGIFYAWAAGNGAWLGDNSNLDGYANHYGVTAACAVNDQGKRSEYSEEGANLWVCAPSSDFTRDRHGIITTDNDDFYRDDFGGTSATAPIVSGVAALVRSANSDLSWRDVKLILAASARQTDPDNAGWEDGALQYGSDTERYHFNHEYGFGVVDAEAAVDLADGWTLVPELAKATADSTPFVGGYMQIPDSRSWVTSSLTLGSEVEFTEFVEINADFDHQYFRDLQVELVSPAGTVSVLSVPYPVAPGESHPAISLRQSFRFGSAKHLGENPAGTWTLRLSDRVPGALPGRLNAWSLTVYGHRSTPSAPGIDEVTPGPGSLSVVWKAPDNSGVSAVSGYDVRYVKASEDETNNDNWTVVDTGWTSGDALAHTIPSLESDVEYDVQVRAVNAQGDGAWSSTATETPSSDAPYFVEGAATTRSVDENASAGTPVGSPVAARDPSIPAETLTYTLSGADAGSFDIDSATGQLSVAAGATLDHETTPSLTVIVTATDPVTTDDPTADADSITVTITVNDVDEPPTLTGETSIAYAENGLLPVATYTATDPEGKSVTWLSLTGTDSGDFTLSNGVLRFATAPDYEARGDNAYAVTVRASDGTTSPATLDVTVTVTNVDEVHTLTELFRIASYAENGTGSVAEYSVSDPESVSPVWALAGTDRGDFTLSGGVLRFANTPDYERPADAGGNNVYTVTVQATAGEHTVEQAVTVRVTPVDEPPELAGPTSVPPYDENRTTQVARYTATDPEGATVLWSVDGDDAAAFDISNGVLHFDPAPNYEARADADGNNDYEVTVVASDGGLTTRQALTVTVTNLNEAGSLTLSSEYPQVETPFTATLTDPDIVSDATWVWERSANRSTWTEIDGAASDRYTPGDDDMNHYLRVTVDYTDGHTASGSKTLQRISANRVRAAPGDNNSPVFPDTTTTRSVEENTPSGRNIGAPVVATDLDDDPLTYSLDTAGDSVFAIDRQSGQLRTKAALDHEATPSYAVTVTATDPSGDLDSIDVTITVADIDEPLTLTGPSTVPHEENSSGTVATFTADDPEQEPITWALAGADRNAFEDINLSGGLLRFRIPPDYEADNRYSVTVEATAGSHTVRQPVTVSITNVNEPPAITGPAAIADYLENSTGPVATYRATDPERDPIQWTLEGADADAFTLSSGVLRFLAPPDYEADDSYLVTVVASDGDLTDALPVTITVTNVDEAGDLTLSSVQPQVDTELTAILSDPDCNLDCASGSSWVWERSPDNRRTWEAVKGTPATHYTPETDDLGAYLRVTATYTDGAGTGSAKSVQVVSPHAVRVPPVNNTPPAFADPTVTRSVVTNAGAGSRVGAPVTAKDPEDDPLTYTLADPAPACFAIDWISGQITVGPQGLLPCANTATRSARQRTISLRAEDSKTYEFTVTVTDPSLDSASIPVFITVASSPPSPPPGPGGGGGSGRGPTCAEDLHGNGATQATGIALAAETAGAICPAADVDYFTVTAPGQGLLFVDTTGGVSLRGTLWQAGVVVASGPARDSRQPGDRLGARVEAGPVVAAVQGQGGATGAYTLVITFVRGTLENPGPASFQSGVGVLSGWVCEADLVEIELNGIPQEAAYGTERLDTVGVCGDVDNGFGLLFNWNLLGDGVHAIVALVDGVELGRVTVTVTTLGEEFVRGVEGECVVAGFPSAGETIRLVWQEAQQNFVLAEGATPTGASQSGTPGVGVLENPSPNSFQSGIGVLSGWVCEAEEVVITIGDLAPQGAGYGTERLDTQDACGDTDNGFGLLFNWNLLGDGEHEVVASADGTELGRTTVRVTTLGEEFVRGAVGECVVADFPRPGEAATLTWQESNQNFVITEIE